MSTKHVILTDDEREAVYEAALAAITRDGHGDALTRSVESILTARERALREEIAEEIEACNTVARRSVSPGQAAYRLGYEVAQGRAARLARGEAR